MKDDRVILFSFRICCVFGKYLEVNHKWYYQHIEKVTIHIFQSDYWPFLNFGFENEARQGVSACEGGQGEGWEGSEHPVCCPQWEEVLWGLLPSQPPVRNMQVTRFLALKGAQEVTICVRPSSPNLSEILNLHLFWLRITSRNTPRALRKHSESIQRALRALKEQSYCIILLEPKELCLVLLVICRARINRKHDWCL